MSRAQVMVFLKFNKKKIPEKKKYNPEDGTAIQM